MTTIERIEARIDGTASISPEDRKSLRALTEELRREVDTLADVESARTVTSYAELSVTEATRKETNKDLLEHAVEGLRRSTEQFRAKHPRLTSLVQDIAEALSRVG